MTDSPDEPAADQSDLDALAAASTPRRRAASPALKARQRSRSESAAVAVARFTMPICLVMGALLLAMGVAWFALPPTSPYKVGSGAVGTALLAAGAAGLFGALALVVDVSRRVRH